MFHHFSRKTQPNKTIKIMKQYTKEAIERIMPGGNESIRHLQYRRGMRTKYFVKDSTGEILRVFYSYKDALSFKIMCARHDYKIEEI